LEEDAGRIIGEFSRLELMLWEQLKRYDSEKEVVVTRT
jgi:hypothetical protein